MTSEECREKIDEARILAEEIAIGTRFMSEKLHRLADDAGENQNPDAVIHQARQSFNWIVEVARDGAGLMVEVLEEE